MKNCLILFLSLFWIIGIAQETVISEEHIQENPLIPVGEESLLNRVEVNFYFRSGFFHHFESGRDDNYSEFQADQVVLDVKAKVHEKVNFRFRNKFNKEATLQTLDRLDNSVELAFVDVEAATGLNLQLGKMFAYFGGYEYELNPIYVLEYNDIQSNLLNYVTGFGAKYKLGNQHTLGFQALNSRTMRYADIYEGHVDDNVEEPKWPLALVGNWEGSFFDGKFETLYSFSSFKVAKGHGTTSSFTLGNKYEVPKFRLMYDFNYVFEQLDTKGIVTEIMGGELIAQDASYIEHWMRAEYDLSEKLGLLLTLMTSNAYKKNAYGEGSGTNHLRTSYGIIPTVYYYPFTDFGLRFYLSYVGRSFEYSSFAKEKIGMGDYHTGEFRIGIIAPLWVF